MNNKINQKILTSEMLNLIFMLFLWSNHFIILLIWSDEHMFRIFSEGKLCPVKYKFVITCGKLWLLRKQYFQCSQHLFMLWSLEKGAHTDNLATGKINCYPNVKLTGTVVDANIFYYILFASLLLSLEL